MSRVKFPEPVAEAIRGIRANMPPGRTMVFDRQREWGGALVKQAGSTWVVSSSGAIFKEGDFPKSLRAVGVGEGLLGYGS